MPGDEHVTNNNFTSFEIQRMVRFANWQSDLGAKLFVFLPGPFLHSDSVLLRFALIW